MLTVGEAGRAQAPISSAAVLAAMPVGASESPKGAGRRPDECPAAVPVRVPGQRVRSARGSPSLGLISIQHGTALIAM